MLGMKIGCCWKFKCNCIFLLRQRPLMTEFFINNYNRRKLMMSGTWCFRQLDDKIDGGNLGPREMHYPT